MIISSTPGTSLGLVCLFVLMWQCAAMHSQPLPISPPELEYKYAVPHTSEPTALPWKDTVPVFLLWQEVADSSGLIFFYLQQHGALGRGSTNCDSNEMKPGRRNRLPPVLSVHQLSFSVLISAGLA